MLYSNWTDALRYVFGGVLSQFINLGLWYSMAYHFQKMILTKTWYKTHNGELLAIVEAFKTWRYYPEVYKHKVLVLTNHNNFFRFMKTKNLGSYQV